jgi:hypothetical protein
LDELLKEGPAFTEDLAPHDPARPLQPAAVEVYRVCSVDNLIGIAVAVKRSDGGCGGELGVIGGLKSIESAHLASCHVVYLNCSIPCDISPHD